MSLTLAAIIIMGGWVVVIVAAGLVMSLRPGGVAIRFAPAGVPPARFTGRREEILLGGEAEVLGNVRGTVQAVQLRPDNLRLQDLQLATGIGVEERDVPANAILSADGRVVRLSEAWTGSPDGPGTEAATLRRDMAVKSVDGKRLGRLRLVCFDRASGTVTALVIAGRGTPSLRTLPIDRVREAGPGGIAIDISGSDWLKLPPFATDWEIREAIMAKFGDDPNLGAVQRSISIDVQDQGVTVRGYVTDRDQVEQVARLLRSVPAVLEIDRKLITDEDLTRAVTDAIQRDPATSAAQVSVSAHLGTVDITGVAPDAATARQIESVASRVPGVQVVHNVVAVRRAASLTA